MNTTTSYKVFETACAIAELSGEDAREIIREVYVFANSDADALELLANDLVSWESRYTALDADTVSNDWMGR